MILMPASQFKTYLKVKLYSSNKAICFNYLRIGFQSTVLCVTAILLSQLTMHFFIQFTYTHRLLNNPED